MMDQKLRERIGRYAELIIRKGCNVPPGGTLVIEAPVYLHEFAHMLIREAYAAGAGDVRVVWCDDAATRIMIDSATIEVIAGRVDPQNQMENELARAGATFLFVNSEDPCANVGADPAKLEARMRRRIAERRERMELTMANKCAWCVAAASREAWATKVFPDLPAEEAVNALWNAILDACRVDENPTATWDARQSEFTALLDWLNAQRFDALRYTSANGTDLTVGLNPNGIWSGGANATPSGQVFWANIPTEEVFTAPDRTRVDGIVHASMPLVDNGKRIEDFWLRFEDGVVIDYDARIGREALDAIITTDEGSDRLGEVALVPYASPIRQSGILYLSTLFDENASCHLALGAGYPECVAGGEDMDDEALMAAGVNVSDQHCDFMIGTRDLAVDGVKPDGTVVPIFRDGDWAPEVPR